MVIFNIIKWFILAALIGTNTIQLVAYRRLKNTWDRLPVVAATIIESKLYDHLDVSGHRKYEARIRFSYDFRGSKYESDTPVMRGPQLFTMWNYEAKLLDKYRAGEMHNARVYATSPPLAFLEIAPFSKVSAILLPILTVVYALYVFGYGAFIYYLFFGKD